MIGRFTAGGSLPAVKGGVGGGEEGVVGEVFGESASLGPSGEEAAVSDAVGACYHMTRCM